MKTVVEVEGLKALDEALGQLPKSIGRAVMRRTLQAAGEPIAQMARSVAPDRSGGLRESIAVSTKVKNSVGMAEFAAAKRAGLGDGAARSALRDARRAARAAGEVSYMEMFVGPSTRAPHAHFVEFGTVKMAPRPFLRPAWDSNKDRALSIVKRELGEQIISAAKRVSRSKRYGADIKYQASIAALMAVEAGS